MKKVFFLLVSVFVLYGCASMESNYRPAIQQSDFPKLNLETTVNVGDAMLAKGTMMSVEFLNILSPIDGILFDIPEGLYPKRGESDGRQYFSTRGEMVDISSGTGVIPAIGMFISYDTPDEICIINANSGFVCYDATYKIITKQIPSTNSKQKTLYFSGKKGNDIMLTYTEQSNGQPVQTHNVTYDTTKNPIVSYKGAEIKVIRTTNETITYEVLKGFLEASEQ